VAFEKPAVPETPVAFEKPAVPETPVVFEKLDLPNALETKLSDFLKANLADNESDSVIPESIDLIEPTNTKPPIESSPRYELQPLPSQVEVNDDSDVEKASQSSRISKSRLKSKCQLPDQNGNMVEIVKLGTRRRKGESDEMYAQRMRQKVYEVLSEMRDKNIHLSRTHIRRVILNVKVDYFDDVIYSVVLRVIDGDSNWNIEQFDKKILKQMLNLKGIGFEKGADVHTLSDIIKQNRSLFEDLNRFHEEI
jgi:hypothetical protein